MEEKNKGASSPLMFLSYYLWILTLPHTYCDSTFQMLYSGSDVYLFNSLVQKPGKLQQFIKYESTCPCFVSCQGLAVGLM